MKQECSGHVRARQSVCVRVRAESARGRVCTCAHVFLHSLEKVYKLRH